MPVYNMNANFFAFNLVFDNYQGNQKIMGAMIPRAPQSETITDHIEGSFDGKELRFTRYMNRLSQTQFYTGTRTADGHWQGEFTEPGVTGKFAWDATPLP